jgi:site-specific recombinase XerD
MHTSTDVLLRLLHHDLTARGYATHTVTEYVRFNRKFLDQLDTPVDRLDRGVALGWIAGGTSPSNRRWRWLALKSLTRLLVDESVLAVNPTSGIPMPKQPQTAQPILADGDLDALIATCNGHTYFDRRDRALLLCLASTGARRFEVAALDVADVNLDQGVVTIRRGKGGKARISFLDSAATRALLSWLHVRGDSAAAALWLNNRGYRLQPDGIRQMLERRSVRAGVKASAHMFRRRLAATWLRNGGSQVGLMAAAGWTSPAMPARYAAAVAVEIAHIEHRRIFDGTQIPS